jgi:hypothetical protein
MFSLPIHKEDIHGLIGGILVAHTGQLINPTTSNQAGPTVHHVVTLADRKITSDNARKKKTILHNVNLSMKNTCAVLCK